MYDLCLESSFTNQSKSKNAGQKIEKFHACPIMVDKACYTPASPLTGHFVIRGDAFCRALFRVLFDTRSSPPRRGDYLSGS